MAKVDARNVILMKEDGSHSGRQGTPKSTRSLRSSHKNDEGKSDPSMVENDLANFDDKDYDITEGDQDLKKDASGKNQKKKGAKPKCHPDKHSERNVFFWCHQCKQKHVQVVCCTRTCSKKYCTRCVWRHYREKVEEVDQTSWVCYYCQGVCSCAFCRRRRAKETNTKFESHRGKKRRITVDASPDEPVPKKRKIKSPTKVDTSSVDQPYRGMINEKTQYLMKTEDSVPESVQDDVEVASFEENEIREEMEGEIGDLPHAQKDVSATMMALRKLRSRSDSKTSQDKGLRGSNKDRRVTLKDLIDAGILKEGDELSVRNASKPAILLADGQIQWGTSVYRSLSTFTKQVAAKLELEKKTTLHNGWRSVYCRGKVMQHYQKEYRQLLVSRKDDYDSDEQDESMRISTDSNEIFNDYKLTSDENSDKSFEAYATPSPSSSPSDISPQLLHESQGFLQNRNPSRRHKMRLSNSSWTEQLQAPEIPMEEIEEQWWMGMDDDSDDQIDSSPMSDDFSSPISCFPDEHERDLLVIGHVDQFLDIRDKDFFNVTSNDDIFTHRSHSHGLEDNGLTHNAHHVHGDEIGDWGDLESF